MSLRDFLSGIQANILCSSHTKRVEHPIHPLPYLTPLSGSPPPSQGSFAPSPAPPHKRTRSTSSTNASRAGTAAARPTSPQLPRPSTMLLPRQHTAHAAPEPGEAQEAVRKLLHTRMSGPPHWRRQAALHPAHWVHCQPYQFAAAVVSSLRTQPAGSPQTPPCPYTEFLPRQQLRRG